MVFNGITAGRDEGRLEINPDVTDGIKCEGVNRLNARADAVRIK